MVPFVSILFQACLHLSSRAGFFFCYSKKWKTEAKAVHLFSFIKELECHALKMKLLQREDVRDSDGGGGMC